LTFGCPPPPYRPRAAELVCASLRREAAIAAGEQALELEDEITESRPGRMFRSRVSQLMADRAEELRVELAGLLVRHEPTRSEDDRVDLDQAQRGLRVTNAAARQH
jgi:hypothetical protein